MSIRTSRPDPAPRAVTKATTRPPIWVDGHQAPPFDVAAFGRVSLTSAVGLAAKGLDSAALQAQRACLRVAARPRRPAVRASGLARLAPSRASVIAALAATGGLLAAAGQACKGRAEPGLSLTIAPRNPKHAAAFAPVPTPAPDLAPAAKATADLPPRKEPDRSEDQTMAAIRSLLRSEARLAVPAAHRHTAAPVLQPNPANALPEARSAERIIPRLIAGLAIAVLLPLGPVVALRAHLSGEDLRHR